MDSPRLSLYTKDLMVGTVWSHQVYRYDEQIGTTSLKVVDWYDERRRGPKRKRGGGYRYHRYLQVECLDCGHRFDARLAQVVDFHSHCPTCFPQTLFTNTNSTAKEASA